MSPDEDFRAILSLLIELAPPDPAADGAMRKYGVRRWPSIPAKDYYLSVQAGLSRYSLPPQTMFGERVGTPWDYSQFEVAILPGDDDAVGFICPHHTPGLEMWSYIFVPHGFKDCDGFTGVVAAYVSIEKVQQLYDYLSTL